MKQFSKFFLKGTKAVFRILIAQIDGLVSFAIFYTNGIKFSDFKSNGWPIVNISMEGQCSIGKGFVSNNREMSNPIGRFRRCSIIVGGKGRLVIGDYVGMSGTSIVCHDTIIIGNYVKIGGNVVIYDTDFHSLDSKDRIQRQKDIENTKTKPVNIGNHTFIGAHSTILKGVSIGENVIIGACSVVTKNIPDNEIWAGNPARFIRKL